MHCRSPQQIRYTWFCELLFSDLGKKLLWTVNLNRNLSKILSMYLLKYLTISDFSYFFKQFPGMFEDIPEMFNDIPRNIWWHSPENNISPTLRVPHISFPVPLFLVLYIAFNLLYCTITDFSDSNISLFLRRHKQTTDNQKTKLLYKIGLNCAVCKVFKNYRMQNMFRIWSSISAKVNNSLSVGRWAGGRWF